MCRALVLGQTSDRVSLCILFPTISLYPDLSDRPFIVEVPQKNHVLLKKRPYWVCQKFPFPSVPCYYALRKNLCFLTGCMFMCCDLVTAFRVTCFLFFKQFRHNRSVIAVLYRFCPQMPYLCWWLNLEANLLQQDGSLNYIQRGSIFHVTRSNVFKTSFSHRYSFADKCIARAQALTWPFIWGLLYPHHWFHAQVVVDNTIVNFYAPTSEPCRFDISWMIRCNWFRVE